MSSALYDGFIVDYYDAAPMVAGRPHDVAFYCDAAREFGDPVLELGCGTGRVTMALAERGYRVTGLDLSKPMLERAEEKRAKLPAEKRALVHLLHGDMTRFDLREKFSLVIIPFRPFQHLLETDQQVSCLDSVRRHLTSEGRRFRERSGGSSWMFSRPTRNACTPRCFKRRIWSPNT